MMTNGVAALLTQLGPLERLDEDVAALLVRLERLERLDGLGCLAQLL